MGIPRRRHAQQNWWCRRSNKSVIISLVPAAALSSYAPFTEARIVKVKKTAFQLGPLICSQCSKLGEPCLLQIIQKCFHIYFTGLMPGDFWFNSTPQLADEIIVEQAQRICCLIGVFFLLTCSYGGSLCAGISRETKYRACELPSCHSQTRLHNISFPQSQIKTPRQRKKLKQMREPTYFECQDPRSWETRFSKLFSQCSASC